MVKRILIQGVRAISMDPAIGDFGNTDILIDGKKIAEIRPGIVIDDVEVIDGTDRLALPGFIDSHRHTWQSAIHGVAADWTHRHYYAGTRQTLGRHYRPQDIYIGNLMGVAESLDAGVTTTMDWSHNMNSPEHADAAFEGLRDSGGRAVLAYGDNNEGWLPISGAPISHDARRVRDQHFASKDQLVTMAMALRGPEFSTLEATLHDYKFARELGLPISVHVGSGEWGKGRPVAKLKEHQLLGTDVTYVHCNSLADDEIQIIADSGGTASVSPEVEMQMEMGFPAAGRLAAVGVRPSLSLDVPNALGVNMFSQMRFLLEVQRAMDNEKAIASKRLFERFPMNCRDVLEFATIAGARTLGIDHKAGSLTPGKEADLILVRTDTLSMTPLNNPVGQFVLAGHPGMIDKVFVAGRCVKRDGGLVDLDVGRIRRLAVELQEYLFRAAGVKAGGEWIPEAYHAHHTEAAAAVTTGTT